MSKVGFRAGLLALSLFSVAAQACPEGQSESDWGMCLPNIGGDVGKAWEHLKREGQAELGGEALALWLQQSHDATERGGTYFVPPHIKQQLAGYIDANILNTARFVVGDPGALNAAHVIEQSNGGVMAVALIDIIVFRNVWDVNNNVALWAHELTHVKQYRDWGGVRNFAISYARDNGAVEREAYAVQNGYWPWANRRQPPAPTWPAPFNPQLCMTPQLSCPMTVLVPSGSSCVCATQYGQIPGVAQ